MNRKAEAGALVEAGQNTTTFQLPSKRQESAVMATSAVGESAIGMTRGRTSGLGVLIAAEDDTGTTIAASIAIDAVQNRMGLSPASAISDPRH
jgi:hypothetical protein